MAEGFARELLCDENSIVDSAGVRADGINKLAIQVMHEINIDISNQISKDMSSVDFNLFDIIVTVCDHAQKNCPFVSEKKIIHHPIMDPVNFKGSKIQTLEVYRKVRGQVKQMVIDILEDF
tara:strand:- start:34 stop:396 length:363 start_codon:yes stop_codon:yes gene_type:complete